MPADSASSSARDSSVHERGVENGCGSAGTGRISIRKLAERAQVADNTASARRAELLDAGVLQVAATYRDDGQACDLYTLGPAAMPFRDQLESTCDKACTPRPRLLGGADPAKLRARHQAQRAAYRPRTLNSANIEAIEKAYPQGWCHGSAIAASRLRQRAWWDSLTEAEKAERIELVRRRNDALPADDRDRWFGWLDARTSIDEAIDHLLDGTANARDRAVLATAPMTVHHGRRDPLWRVGGTPPRPTASVPQRAAQPVATAAPTRARRPIGNSTSPAESGSAASAAASFASNRSKSPAGRGKSCMAVETARSNRCERDSSSATARSLSAAWASSASAGNERSSLPGRQASICSR